MENAGERRTAELIALDREHVWHPLTQHQRLTESPPILFTGGEGAWVTDSTGKRYLDGMAGLWCVNVGYGRTELADAAARQMKQLPYFPLTQTHEPAIQLSAKVASLLHEGISHVWLSSSGSEANENAFKIARQWGRQSAGRKQDRYKIIGRRGAYHGTTLATLAAGGMTDRKAKFEPLPAGFAHAPAPYCYRCPFAKSPGACNLECASALEQVVVSEGAETVAAVIVEPIMSGLGIVVPPDGYLEQVEQICRKHGLLLIVDEVINGFGRTGMWFGHQNWNIKPDIISMAKGISSAYQPLAATAVTRAVFDTFLGDPAEMKHLFQVNTFGGHPVACAVATANIAIYERERLLENAVDVGGYLLDSLHELRRYPKVGDVRGKGLLIGVELVEDQTSRAPLPGGKMGAVVKAALNEGLILSRSAGSDRNLGNTLTISPPLVLNRSEADRIVTVLEKIIRTL